MYALLPKFQSQLFDLFVSVAECLRTKASSTVALKHDKGSEACVSVQTAMMGCQIDLQVEQSPRQGTDKFAVEPCKTRFEENAPRVLLQALKLLSSRCSCYVNKPTVSKTDYNDTIGSVCICLRQGSPFTICRCLFIQLLGISCRRWSTTWLLCSRLVRSYHAVAIMAFSRCRFLMIWSFAACTSRPGQYHSI